MSFPSTTICWWEGDQWQRSVSGFEGGQGTLRDVSWSWQLRPAEPRVPQNQKLLLETRGRGEPQSARECFSVHHSSIQHKEKTLGPLPWRSSTMSPPANGGPSAHRGLNEVHTLYTSEGYGKKESGGFQRPPSTQWRRPPQQPRWGLQTNKQTNNKNKSKDWKNQFGGGVKPARLHGSPPGNPIKGGGVGGLTQFDHHHGDEQSPLVPGPKPSQLHGASGVTAQRRCSSSHRSRRSGETPDLRGEAQGSGVGGPSGLEGSW